MKDLPPRIVPSRSMARRLTAQGVPAQAKEDAADPPSHLAPFYASSFASLRELRALRLRALDADAGARELSADDVRRLAELQAEWPGVRTEVP